MKQKIIRSVFAVLLAFAAAFAVMAIGTFSALKTSDPAVMILPSSIAAFAVSCAVCGTLAGKLAKGSSLHAAVICVSYFAIYAIASLIIGALSDGGIIPQLTLGARLLMVLGGVLVCFIAAVWGSRKKSHGRSRATGKRKNSIASRMRSRAVGV